MNTSFIGTPRELFQGMPRPQSSLIPFFTYVASKDGQRFLVALPPGQNVGSPALSVLLNWQLPEAH